MLIKHSEPNAQDLGSGKQTNHNIAIKEKKKFKVNVLVAL